MHSMWKSGLLVAAVWGLVACSGEPGADGKDGKDGGGTNGTNGSNGTNGTDHS